MLKTMWEHTLEIARTAGGRYRGFLAIDFFLPESKGRKMKFIQVMEQSGDIEEARAEIEGYFASADTETMVKKLILCEDRDVPGKIVTIVEFESWETATANNDLDATQEGAAEAQATTDITYQNLDVHHEWVS